MFSNNRNYSHIINKQGDSYRLKEKKDHGIVNSDIYKLEAKTSNKLSENIEAV